MMIARKVTNRTYIYLLFIFMSLLFPGLLFSENLENVDVSLNKTKIKTMVNIPHYKEVNIIHEINERLIATYSKHDKKLKIWNKSNFRLLSEYNSTEGVINQLFSIGERLFAKSRSAFYKIDLVNDSIEKILSDANLSSITIINDRYILFTDSRYGNARIVAYDYLNNVKKSKRLDMDLCRACSVEKFYYSKKKYYALDGFDVHVYDNNLKFTEKFSIRSLKKKFISDPNMVSISKAVEHSNNIFAKNLIQNRKKLKFKIKDKISIETKYYSIKKNERTDEDIDGFPLRKFYLVNKQTGKSILLTAGVEEYAASNATTFREEFIDTQNKIVAIRHHDYNIDGFLIVDFSGNILGGTKYFDLDDIALVPIENFLFLINYTKGNIVLYDLKKQDINAENKKFIIDGEKISMMNRPPGNSKDVLSYKELKKSHVFNDNFDIVDINLSGVLLTAILADNSIKTWDVNTGKLLATKYIFSENTVVTITPEGYFSGKGNYEDKIHFVDDKLNSYSFNQFARRFYRPEIVQLSLSGKPPSNLESIESVIVKQKAPSIKIISPDNNFLTPNDTVLVKVKIKDNGGGVGDVYFYVNDVLVSTDTKAITVVPKGESKISLFNISLSEGDNRIRVIAYNKTNTMNSESDIIAINSSYKFDVPSLYVLAVGIDTYENDDLNLKYAVADLELFTENIEKLSGPLFKNVKIISLSKQQDTTKNAISRAFDRLALDVKAGDYFIFYNSYHGYIASFSNGDSKFFLITSNVIFLDPENLKKAAISQDELVGLVGSISAQNKIIVLDTCQSGEAGRIIQMAMAGAQKTYTRALSSATAMQLLKMASGSSVFTASQNVEAAIEGYKGHGLFTYTLVEGMKGLADGNNDNFITLGELKSYVERRVFDRSKKYFRTKQMPYINIGTIDLSISQVK